MLARISRPAARANTWIAFRRRISGEVHHDTAAEESGTKKVLEDFWKTNRAAIGWVSVTGAGVFGAAQFVLARETQTKNELKNDISNVKTELKTELSKLETKIDTLAITMAGLAGQMSVLIEKERDH
jgi:uncharacterized protein YlxW (UPF0749 family)